jgi:hypothetical protein
MADFASTASGPGDHFAIGDYSASDSGADGYVNEILGSNVIAESSFGEGCESCIVPNPNRHRHGFCQTGFHRFVVPTG